MVYVTLWGLLLITCATVACTSESLAPQRPFSTESMLVDATLFQSGWRNRSIIPTADSHGAIEHLLRTMEGLGTIVHEIYRYERVGSAQREYHRQLDVWYPGARYYGAWKEETEMARQLDFADEAYVACASYYAPQVKEAKLCHMLARYGEFVVRFSAEIAPSAAPMLDEEALAELLERLDERWEAAIASPPTPSP